MKLPVLKAPILVNIVVIFFSALISWFTLLFGIAHIIEGSESRYPNISNSVHLLGVAVVITLCVIGVIFFVITIAAIRGILFQVKKRKEPQKSDSS